MFGLFGAIVTTEVQALVGLITAANQARDERIVHLNYNVWCTCGDRITVATGH